MLFPDDEIPAGPYTFQDTSGQVRGEFTINSRWVATGNGRVLHCNEDAVISVKKTHGISQETVQTINDSLGIVFGAPALFSLKSHIEAATSEHFRWQEEEGVEHEFRLRAPGCGTRSYMIYRLDRYIDLTITRFRRFRRTPCVDRLPLIVERSDFYDLRIVSENDDPRCPCPTPYKPSAKQGTVVLSFNKLLIHSDATIEGGVCRFSLGGRKEIKIAEDERSFEADPIHVPDLLHFLGDPYPSIDTDLYVREFIEDEQDVSDEGVPISVA